MIENFNCMYPINPEIVTEEFARCWKAAGLHLDAQGDGSIKWLRAHIDPPFLEHLSFRLGNQLFFIQVEDVDRELTVPGNLSGLLQIAKACEGHPLALPMKKLKGEWHPQYSGWGLLHVLKRTPINPAELISDNPVEMTDWELQDFAVQVVRTQLEQEGHQIMSYQSDPGVDPSIWFVGKNGPEWVAVRAARWPASNAPHPSSIEKTRAGFEHVSKHGNFAGVVVANAKDPFDPTGENALPLLRGHELSVKFTGLEPLINDDNIFIQH